MKTLMPLDGLNHRAKDVLIHQLWQERQALPAEVEELKRKRGKEHHGRHQTFRPLERCNTQ